MAGHKARSAVFTPEASAIHVFLQIKAGRGCPAQGRA
jgi:hypothetical protein